MMMRSLQLALGLLIPLFAFGQTAPTEVIAFDVREKSFSDQLEALGTLSARESVEIRATVTERVITVNFEDGQNVKKGDLLVEMDYQEEQAALLEEQSVLDEARLQANRIDPLVASGAATQSVLDERQRSVNTALARMQAIQSRIDQRRIRAPFDGVLGFRNISVGALVEPVTVITTIDDIDVMKLDFTLPAIHLSRLQPGTQVEAQSAAFPGERFLGEVRTVSSRVDPISRSVTVRAVVDNPEGLLKPGMLMQVQMASRTRQALVIPEESLISVANKNYVFAIDNQREPAVVDRQEVIIGQRNAGEVEILSGLSAGQQIVTHGITRISAGAPVKIISTQRGGESLADLLPADSDERRGADTL